MEYAKWSCFESFGQPVIGTEVHVHKPKNTNELKNVLHRGVNQDPSRKVFHLVLHITVLVIV